MSKTSPAETRQSYSFKGIVTALSSISHIGDTFGVNAKLRREKIIQPDGRVEQVPIFSGNAMRGLLRDLGMAYMLTRIGSPKLSMTAFYFLFSGGALSKISSKTIDLELARKLREAIPLVGLFGGAVGNQILPGRMNIGKLIPICAETLHILPADIAGETQVSSIWEYLQEEAYTRKDDAKDERKRFQIQDADLTLLDDKTMKKRAALGTDEDVDRESGQHQQMRYYSETWAAGTRFHWSISLIDVSDLEFQAFLSCLVAFSKNPVIGGKGNIGHGKVAINFDQWLSVNPNVETGEAIDLPVGQRYNEHLESRASDILNLLSEL